MTNCSSDSSKNGNNGNAFAINLVPLVTNMVIDQAFKAGVNSEHASHAIQGRFIHEAIKDARFEITSWDWKGYFQYQTTNIFTSW